MLKVNESKNFPRRFGEMLSTMVPLSAHDIDEILCEQTSTHRRFGDIALSLGLCQPEHVWEACFAQLETAIALPCIDLATFGVDAQAVSLCNAEIAERAHIIPLRVFQNTVLIAIASDISEPERKRIAAEIAAHLRREVRFVVSERSQIRDAIAKYYSDRN